MQLALAVITSAVAHLPLCRELNKLCFHTAEVSYSHHFYWKLLQDFAPMLSNFQPLFVYGHLISICCQPNTFLQSLFMSLTSASTARLGHTLCTVKGIVQRPQWEET